MFIYGIPRIAKLTLVKEKQVNAMDTRATYMFEVINEMYVNQRIKLEWNIVGSDFWDAPLSEDSLNHGFFPLYYSHVFNYEEFVFETDECNEARNQRRVVMTLQKRIGIWF